MPDRRLRIAVTSRAVAPWHGRGGLERHVADLVRHLARRDIDVTLIAPPPRDPSLDRANLGDGNRVVHALVVPYRTFPGAGRRGTTILDRDTAYVLFGWRAGRAALRLAAAGEVDLVHGLGASVLGYARAKRRNARLPPLVLNPQGLEEFGATDPARAGLKVLAYWPLQRAVRACARAADAVLATDRTLVSVVTRHLDVPESRVPVVPNAVDLEWCEALATASDGASLRRARGIDPEVPVLLSVGRLERSKGFHVLVDALARLGRDSSNWRWVLVGDGSFRSTLIRQIETAGLAPQIVWTGPISDAQLHAWYEAADLFVHPTLYEGSSLVTLEAMAHRLPVVATRAGGLPDKVHPGVNGWLVPPGDADAMRAALVEAFSRRSDLERMGHAGRRLVAESFAWPAVAARLEGIYRGLVG